MQLFLLLLGFIFILINFIILIINRKIYKTQTKLILLLLGILLFPIFACSIELIAQSRDINLLMATSLYLPIVVLIKQIELIKIVNLTILFKFYLTLFQH